MSVRFDNCVGVLVIRVFVSNGFYVFVARTMHFQLVRIGELSLEDAYAPVLVP
jgi:hypothetical protein